MLALHQESLNGGFWPIAAVSHEYCLTAVYEFNNKTVEFFRSAVTPDELSVAFSKPVKIRPTTVVR